jgi:hypothetical protein
MENKKRGGRIGANSIGQRGMEYKAWLRGEKNILLNPCFVSGTILIISLSHFEDRVGRMKRRRMLRKGGYHWGRRTVFPRKKSPQL